MANFYNRNNDSLVSGTSENDSIYNYGSNVTINAGNGNDTVNNELYDYNRPANSVKIYTGDGNDSVRNFTNSYTGYGVDSVTIDTGAGNDTLSWQFSFNKHRCRQ